MVISEVAQNMRHLLFISILLAICMSLANADPIPAAGHQNIEYHQKSWKQHVLELKKSCEEERGDEDEDGDVDSECEQFINPQADPDYGNDVEDRYRDLDRYQNAAQVPTVASALIISAILALVC